MLKLHGTPLSNYYNKVKMALLEKGIPFEEVRAKPSQDEAYLAVCPTGKVPHLELADGRRFCESQAILDYLEECYPQVTLLPQDPFERAKVRELMQIFELSVELVVRRMLPHAIFGAPLNEGVKTEVQAQLDRGMAAFSRVARFAPFVAGEHFTQADCAIAMHIPLMTRITMAVYQRDWLADLPVAAYLEQMKQRPSYQRIRSDLEAARVVQG